MPVIPIVCDNCGAKYRLPESFSGDKAKCKQCGSVIDVAAQKAAAAGPAGGAATAAPAKAGPSRAGAATGRKATAEKGTADRGAGRRSSRSQAAEQSPRRRRGGRDRGASADGDDEGTGRRGTAPKRNNTMMLVGGGVGALAIISVIIVLSTGGKDEPAKNEQANAAPTPAANAAGDESGKPATQEPAAQVPEAAPPAPDAAPDAAGQANPAETQPADASAKAPQPKAADGDAADGEPKEKWERNTTTSLADVFDPSTLGDLTWPKEVDDAQKEEIRSLVNDIVDGGRPGISAKPKLEEIGYYAVYGLIERLRHLDYKSSDEQMTAWELNKLLEAITVGLNAGFVAVNPGEDIDPRKADHNARTTKAWDTLLERYPDKQSFDENRKKRLAK